VIEDSPVGVRAARAAGMTAIGFAGASHATPQLAADLDSAGAARVITAMADLRSAVAGVVQAK
jgi:beta-phosphoglucomutase-like phosphatase (HAD superfamily)